MKTSFHSNRNRNGIAMIIVMITIFVLAMLAGKFAVLMKVETKLARNANSETELIWLGRSGVELAKCFLAQPKPPNEPYDSLNQIWAGGPGGANEKDNPLAGLSLTDYKLGGGTISVKITDLERKVNINIAGEDTLQQALTVMGVDAGDIPIIANSILDWIDPDDDPHINGTESDYYQTLNPAYFAKNGPIDDLSELLLVRGVTPPIYWGPSYTSHVPAAFQEQFDKFGRLMGMPTNSVGLADLFTPISSGKININTASAATLQVLGIDENTAQLIIKTRAGPDGADGTEDDTPFRGVGELVNAGVSRLGVPQLARFCTVQSATFQVEVDAQVGDCHKHFYAILGRTSQTDLQTLSFYWK